MRVKVLIPLLLSFTLSAVLGCGKPEAGTNNQSVETAEADENEADTTNAVSDKELDNVDAVSGKEMGHEAYIRHYYEIRNYKVNEITISKESGRDRYSIDVHVIAPYGECYFTHRVSAERFDSDAWYESDWEPDSASYYPDADSFLGKWSYLGQAAEISITIHKVDLSQGKIAYEYACDCQYVSDDSRGTRDYFTGESDRILTSDIEIKDDGYRFEIGGVKAYLDPIYGVKVSMFTLSQSDNYNKVEPFLPASKILTLDTPVYQEERGLTGNNALSSYKGPFSRFNYYGLANNDGDGKRKKQTYLICGSYQSLCGTAYISGKEDLTEYFDKSAEIYIYGDGKLLKTISDKEVKDADYELYFEVDVSNVTELTFDMPGELLYKKESGWGVDKPLLNLANLVISKHDTYRAAQFSYSREGALEFQETEKADEYMISSYSFYEETGFRPVFLTVTYDKRFFELNDNFEYDLNEQEVRKYAEDIFDDVTEPGTDSFLMIYFSDGVEPDRKVVDRYFCFYSPDNEKAVEKIEAWFLNTRDNNSDRLSDRVIDILRKNQVMFLDL